MQGEHATATAALAETGVSAVDHVLRRRTAPEALAAEKERLFVQQRDIAGTLQQALLADLPSPSDLGVAAREATARAATVGGAEDAIAGIAAFLPPGEDDVVLLGLRLSQ